MASKNRLKTKEFLEESRFNELPSFAKIVLQKLNIIICSKQQNNETFLHKKLNEIYYKFPRKRDYEQLESIIVFHILSSLLRISTRPNDVLDMEEMEFEDVCGENEEYSKLYARTYMTRLCPLCFNGGLRLKHSL